MKILMRSMNVVQPRNTYKEEFRRYSAVALVVVENEIVERWNEKNEGEAQIVSSQIFEFDSRRAAERALNQLATAESARPWDSGTHFILNEYWLGTKGDPTNHELLELSRPIEPPVRQTVKSL